MINSVIIRGGFCGCLHAIYDPVNPIVSPYVAFDSSKNVFDDNYKPYTADDDDNVFYVPYNYETMQEAIKIADVTEAPSLTAFDRFFGTYIDPDTGESIDYLFTPVQLLEYISEQTTLLTTALVADISTTTIENDTLTLDWFADREIKEITTNQATYLSGYDFTQSGSSIIWALGSWYNGQPFRAKS